MDFDKLLKITNKFEKQAQEISTSSTEPGAYIAILKDLLGIVNADKFNPSLDPNSPSIQFILNTLQKFGAYTIIDIQITIQPNLNVVLQIKGNHPKLPKAASAIKSYFEPRLTAALKKANAANPPGPVSWMWISDFGFEA